MVRILALLACAIDGVPYKHLVNLIRSLPNSNDDFGIDFDSWRPATGPESKEPLLRFRTEPTRVAEAAARANAAYTASGR